MSAERYENVIIGSGEGGKYLAWHLAQAGQRTAVVERRWIGGSCPNVNCLPSKNEIWSAKVADLVRHGQTYGSITGPTSVDMVLVRERKREMVARMVAFHVERYRATGVDLILGEATLSGSNSVDVRVNDGGTRTLQAERLFLNVGTHATIPEVLGLAESGPMTNIEALEIGRLPEHLIVIGGGYVGLELAQAFRRFGSEVTIIEHGARMLHREDRDVADEIHTMLTDDGIEIIVPAEIASVEGRSGQRVILTVRTPVEERIVEGTDILVASGRTPNTAGMGLEAAGIELGPHGYVKVNDRLETTAPNVWAIGECAGSPQFTHVSFDDFRVVRDNLAGGNRTTRDRLIPYCMFTDPQVAHVGLTEVEADRRRIGVRVVKSPMSAVLRAQTIGETRGFMKGLVGADDDRVLGFTMIGPEAGEVVSVVQMAMLAGQPYAALRDAIITHPTMGEALNALFAKVPPRV